MQLDVDIPDRDDPNTVTSCINGMAGIYPCNNYDLLSHIEIIELATPAATGNDCWGWTDPETGKEYALFCTSTGTSFIDVSDGVNPVIIGRLPSFTGASIWRDVKTYANYAFVVSEAPGHGMQVFDLTRLRDADTSNGPIEFSEDAHYNGFGNAHNIVINEDMAYAYAVGTATFSGGPHFIDISNPLIPVAAGGYARDEYSHDAQVVTYNGPDTDYSGREILIGSNENEVAIVDVTNKNNPRSISTISYANIGYTHQGWFTEDMRYFILGDETDEILFGLNSRTLVFDLQDLDDPKVHMSYFGPTGAVDHNGYVKGDTYYLANYTAGVRMIDISTIDDSFFTEVGFFDTFPNGNGTASGGAWNVYPYFPSGNILISDINSGMFLIRKR
jgi:choice-of-anchor B domain-containing protein